MTVLLLLAEARLLAGWQAGLLDQANVAIFFSDPAQTALQLLSMRYSPVNLDPLLLMVILHFMPVIVLPAMVRFPTTMLIASAFLYFASHYFDWSIPTYPRGEIYFNPLNWQVLYLIGVLVGCDWQRQVGRAPQLEYSGNDSRGLSAVCPSDHTGWQFHSLESYVPLTVSQLIYPIDKGNLDILRVLHFLALALIFRRLLPSHRSRPTVDALSPIIRCGEFSLVIYCSSVLLSFAGHAVLSICRNNLTTQTLVSIASLVVLAVIADLLARNDRSGVCDPRTI